MRLAELHAGDPALLNTYAVIAPASKPDGAALALWMAEGGGRDLVSRMISSGRMVGFQLWPADRPGTRPDAVPY